MAISVFPGSASMTINQRPGVNVPSVNGSLMQFTSSTLRATGKCQLTGATSDNPANWVLGLIQLQWIETNWGYYRGQVNTDGSCFLQRARPPARPAQGCRDTIAAGAVFVDNNPGLDRTVAAAGQRFPINMSASFFDAPNDNFPLTRRNSLTGRTNFLEEAQLEFHFCTILSLRSPTGVFQHLKHFLWNVHWQARFKPTNYANLAAAWTITPTGGSRGNGAHVSNVFDGGPTDRRFTGIITAPGAPNCNVTARNAEKAPNTRESRVWENFRVGR
jgi:hypothetical protein